MKYLFLLAFVSGCSQSKPCPCGYIPYNGGCAWEYFYIDKRPQCKDYLKPSTYKPKN